MDRRPTLESLFHAALEIESPAARDQFLEQACRNAPEIKDEVKRLLGADAQVGGVLDAGPPLAESTVSHSVIEQICAKAGKAPQTLLREPRDQEPVLQVNSPELPSERQQGRYQLHGELARGGMGAILRGRDNDIGRDLVFKVLLESHRDKPEYIRRFVEEAQIGGQLQHPGIVPVYELGQLSDERPFFTMKLVKGKTLAALLADRESHQQDQGKFLGIFSQVCQTVAYAHAKGVIHRDLKPANVMVGAFGEVQVMDWGLAKVVAAGGIADEKRSLTKQTDATVIRTVRSSGSDTGDATGSDTRLGSVLGTLAYMPPEQALGETDRLDERADVFALGSVLAEILTGCPAYVATDSCQLHRMAARGNLDECLARLANCGAEHELVELAKRCLEPELHDRLRNADVVAQGIAEFQGNLEQRLKQAELDKVASDTRAREEQRRRRLLRKVALTAIVAGIGLTIAAGAFFQLARHNAQLTAAAERDEQAALNAAQLEQVRRFAANSETIRTDRPIRSARIALEAARNSITNLGTLTPEAHEAIMNAAQTLEGYPLAKSPKGVLKIVIGNERLVTLEDDTCHVWDLSMVNPMPSSFALKEPGITDICLSSDGRHLVAIGNRIVHWDLSQSAQLTVISTGKCTHVGLSGNGKWAVVQSKNGDVNRWELSRPKQAKSMLLKPAATPWNETIVSNDGRWIASRVGADSRVRPAVVMRVRGDRVEELELESGSNNCTGFSMHPDGRMAITSSEVGVRTWDLTAENPLETPTAPWPTIKSIRLAHFTPSGRWLYFWADRERLIRADVSNPVLPTVEVPCGDVPYAAMSDDGLTLAFSEISGDVNFKDLSNPGKPRSYTLKAHDAWGRRAVLSPDGNWMASSSRSGEARLWRIDARRPQSPVVLRGTAQGGRLPFAVSSSGVWTAQCDDGVGVEIWKCPDQDSYHGGAISRRVFTDMYGPDANLSDSAATKVAICDNDRWLAVSTNSQVSLRDLQHDDRPPIVLDAASPLAVTGDGKWLATGHKSGSTLLWDLGSIAEANPIPIHTFRPRFANPDARFDFSPDSSKLAVVEEPHLRLSGTETQITNVRIWDLTASDIPGSRRESKFENPLITAGSMAFDASSHWLALGGNARAPNERQTVLLLDLRQPLDSPFVVPHLDSVYRIAISAGARWLFTSRYLPDTPSNCELWDLANPLQPKAYPIYDCEGEAAAISPDGRWLAASSHSSNKICLWDLTAPEPLSSRRLLRGHTGPAWNLKFTGDSNWLLSWGSEGAIRRWCMDAPWLTRYVTEMTGRPLTKFERQLHKLD